MGFLSHLRSPIHADLLFDWNVSHSINRTNHTDEKGE